MGMFSGSSNFTLIDQITQDVLKNFFDKIDESRDDQGQVVVDLRAEVINIFESIVTTYLFGRDVSK